MRILFGLAFCVGVSALSFAPQHIAMAQDQARRLMDAYGIAEERRDWAEAFRLAERLAAVAGGWTWKLGDHYWDGRGTQRDERKAVALYREAAAKGAFPGKLRLARAFWTGRGTARDPAEAARWLRLAAEGGSPEAHFELSTYYRIGIGVAQDPAEADRLIAAGLAARADRLARIPEAMRPPPSPRWETYNLAYRAFACPQAAPRDPLRAVLFLAEASAAGMRGTGQRFAHLASTHPFFWRFCRRER